MSRIGNFLRSMMGPDEQHEAAVLMELRKTQAFGVLPVSQTGKPRYPKRTISTYEDDGYAKLALVFRCIGITSQLAGTAPVRVYREDLEGARKTVPNHPLRQLMRRPNAFMGESRFISYVTMVTSVAGFCVVEKERDLLGNVIGLWPLESNRCRAILRSQRQPDWEYTISASHKEILKAEDVLVFTYADRSGSPYGIAPLEVAFRELGILNQMIDFLMAFFQNGAMPVYGLVPETDSGQKMDQTKVDLIKDKWRRRHAGLQNSIDPAILVGIKDVKRLSFDFSELAYVPLRDLSDLAICQAFGIDPLMVGTRIGMEKSTYSNKEEARKGCYQDTVIPLWSRFDDTLEIGLLEEFPGDGSVSLDFDISKIQALQENRNDKASWLTSATLGGAISVHTYHQELGLPKPDGDDFYLRGIATEAVPVTDPLGMEAIARDEAFRKELADKQAEKAKALPAGDAKQSIPEDPTDADEARALAIIREQRGRVSPRERRAAIGTVNRRNVSRIARKATPWVQGYFRDAGKRISMKAARSAETGMESREVTKIDWEAEERELTKAITKIYQLSGDTATAAVNEQLGLSLDFNLANPKLKSVRSLLAERVKGINAENRSVIQNLVTDALDSGKTTAELSAEISSKFGEWSDGRAMTIARTESMSSYGMASTAQYRESGVVDRIECFDNPSHSEDYGAEDGLSCADRDGLIAPLADAELHIRSEHPNGQLAIGPVLEGED